MSKRINTGGVTKGSWTEAEDDVLRNQVKMRGDDELCNGWAEIAEHIPGRSAKQCRERWVQNLKPSLNRGPITVTESEFIKRQVNLIGPKWAEIARLLRSSGISTRSDNAVKNWYNGNKNRIKRAQRRGREVHDPEMHDPMQQSHSQQSYSHHTASASLGRRSSFLPEISTSSTPRYSPMSSPSTPYHRHSHSHSQSQSHAYSRPSSQQSNQYHYRQSSSQHFSQLQLPSPSMLPLQDGSPYQIQLPVPQPSFGSTRYYDDRRMFDDRRSSVFTAAANSPASDVVVPSLEPDTGSPMIGASQPSPALSQHAGVPAYSLSSLGGGYHYQDKPLAMMRTPSQQSNQSYLMAMEPACAPQPPGSERLAVSNLLN